MKTDLLDHLKLVKYLYLVAIMFVIIIAFTFPPFIFLLTNYLIWSLRVINNGVSALNSIDDDDDFLHNDDTRTFLSKKWTKYIVDEQYIYKIPGFIAPKPFSDYFPKIGYNPDPNGGNYARNQHRNYMNQQRFSQTMSNNNTYNNMRNNRKYP